MPGKTEKARAERPGGRGGVAGNGKPRANGKARANGKTGIADPPEAARGEARRIATELGAAVLVETSVETAQHSDDVELISGEICKQLGISGRTRQDVLAAARLHDIGKSAVRQEVLEKPGPLSDAEWEEMRRHTIVGERILASVRELRDIAHLVRHSHERWDGKGYPDGIAGEEIPLGSRIIFCADAFHAVRSDRPYRRGRSAPAALREIQSCAGTQFDPDVVAALEEATQELRLLPPRRRARRSSRLTALLLVLALGIGGSAVGRSDLLGPVPSGSSADSGGLASCAGADCELFDPLLSSQLEGLGLPVPGAGQTTPRANRPLGGIGAAGILQQQRRGQRDRGRSKPSPKSSGIAAPTVNAPGEPGQSGGSSGSGGGGSGSGGGGSSNPGKPPKPDPPRGPKPGKGGGGNGVGNQGQGGSSAPGTGNGNANPGSWAGGGSPGNSGNSPGHNK